MDVDDVSQDSPIIKFRGTILELVEESRRASDELSKLGRHGLEGMSVVIVGATIDVSDVRVGVVTVFIEHHHFAIIELLDPIGWPEESIGVRDNEGRIISVVLLKSIGGFGHVLIFFESKLCGPEHLSEVEFTLFVHLFAVEEGTHQSSCNGISDPGHD